MNISRINDYIDVYAKAIEMPEEYLDVLKELMQKIISKYEKIHPYILVEEDGYDKYIIKPVDGKYTVEDFMLNRLMRNVWFVDFDAKNEGEYNINCENIHFNREKMENQLERFRKNFEESIESDQEDSQEKIEKRINELNEIAKKRVIMHEFEHALQTGYKKSALHNIDKAKYKKIIEEIENLKDGMYKDEIKTYDEINIVKFGKIEEYEHTGILYSWDEKESRNYRELEGIVDLNEVLNETECLEMVEAKIQGRRYYNDEKYYSFRNIESSDYSITNYGDLIKILAGKKLSFIGMYLNPNIFYRIFNTRYTNIFQEEFQNDKNAIENLVIQLRKIKETDSYEEHEKLQTVLAKCLEKNMKVLVTKADKITLQKKIEEFKAKTIDSDIQSIRLNLEHMNILNYLQQSIIEKDVNDER